MLLCANCLGHAMNRLAQMTTSGCAVIAAIILIVAVPPAHGQQPSASAQSDRALFSAECRQYSENLALLHGRVAPDNALLATFTRLVQSPQCTELLQGVAAPARVVSDLDQALCAVAASTEIGVMRAELIQEEIRALVSAGAHVEARCERGSPLVEAASHSAGLIAKATALLELGANPNARRADTGWTLLFRFDHALGEERLDMLYVERSSPRPRSGTEAARRLRALRSSRSSLREVRGVSDCRCRTRHSVSPAEPGLRPCRSRPRCPGASHYRHAPTAS